MRKYIKLIEALIDDSNEDRLRRAKEMGYDVEDPHYFGTPSGDFDELDLDRTSDENLAYGRGAYSTRDPEAASGYANPGTSWNNRNDDPKPTVYKVFLKVKNPFDLDKMYPYPEIKRIYTHCFDIDELKSNEYFMELAKEAEDYDFIETNDNENEPDEIDELYSRMDDIDSGYFAKSELGIDPDDYDDGVEDDDYKEDIEYALDLEKKSIQRQINHIERHRKESAINHKKMLDNGRIACDMGRDIYKNLWLNTEEYHDYRKEAKLFGGDTGVFEHKTQTNRWLEELGYDGICHVDYYNPGKRGQPHEVTIAFNPSQVKSVHAQFRNDNSKLSEDKSNENVILYHGTSSNYINLICKNGFLPQSYFTPFFEDAEEYAKMGGEQSLQDREEQFYEENGEWPRDVYDTEEMYKILYPKGLYPVIFELNVTKTFYEKYSKPDPHGGSTGNVVFEMMPKTFISKIYKVKWSDYIELSENRNNNRIIIPNNLKNISRNDLKEVYTILRNGHAMDGVIEISPRKGNEIFDEVNKALEKLSRAFNRGNEIILYRTIEINNPKEWIIENMKDSQHLGKYWTYTEHYTQSHENFVLFCIVATTENVDWVETIILAIDGVEDEIRLIPNSAITLRYVEPYDINFEPEQNQLV